MAISRSTVWNCQDNTDLIKELLTRAEMRTELDGKKLGFYVFRRYIYYIQSDFKDMVVTERLMQLSTR